MLKGKTIRIDPREVERHFLIYEDEGLRLENARVFEVGWYDFCDK